MTAIYLQAQSCVCALGDTPEAINEDPYGDGWMVRVKLSDESEKDALLDAKAYEDSLS